MIGRRAFLALAPGAAAAFVAAVRRGEPAPYAALFAWEHPEPRPDVDGSSVLTPEELAGAPHVIDLFDGIRAIPHIADGIRCHCGCAELDGYRSLLSCYEAPGMAQWCEICQGAGRLAVRRAGEGQSLAQIRRAVDARFATPALAVLGARCGAAAT